MVHTTQAEAFVQGPSAGLALSRPATFAAKQRAPGVKVLRRAAVPALRMQEEGLKEEVESGLDERNVRRAGLEIEAVARSVPDLTEPEFNLS